MKPSRMSVCETDAVVVGAGIAGLSAAIGLARRGRRVTILDRKGLAGQASPAAAGILDPVVGMEKRSPVMDLSLRAFDAYPRFIRKLEKESRLSVNYEKTGLFYIAQSGKEEKMLKSRAKWQKRAGVRVFWYRRDRLRAAEPSLGPHVCGALYYPDIGRVHPAKLVRALKKWAVKEKVRIVSVSGDCVLTARNDSVTGTETKSRTWRAPVVVNATGCWSGRTVSLGGKVPVKPVRGQIEIVDGRNVNVRSILHAVDGSYVVPWGGGRYLLGSTVEFGRGYHARTSAAGLSGIRQRVQRMVPELKSAPRLQAWAGLRPYATDRRPLIGSTPLRGLFLATGYYRSGILIGYAAGDLLAKWILSGRIPRILRPFKPGKRIRIKS